MIIRAYIYQTLKEQFQELTDHDVALWKIAVLTGLIDTPSLDNPYDTFQDNKGIFLTVNNLSHKLTEILDLFVKLEFLKKHAHQFKWNNDSDNWIE